MIQQNRIFSVILIMFFALLTSCSKKPQMDLLEATLLPKPIEVSATGSSFELNNETKILVNGHSEELIRTAKYLASLLKPSTGFDLNIESISDQPSSNSIYFAIVELDSVFGNEGYKLIINEENVIIESNGAEGAVRAIQTLRQILPNEIESSSIQQKSWFMATGEIQDYPQYGYRGSMLDVARHFFGLEDVKRYIDLMAAYKLNVLHLHLSDDQGWRIEIKSWPNLTTHGGSTQVGGAKGGFYTQEQYKEIVNYAATRYITVIPEIDMPGHTNAALASYPELNCNGEATELYTGIEVGFSTLCTDKEITYKFIDDVIRELSEMTPGPYIHIGGDESHVTPMEDYIPFVNKVQDIVISHGKKVIGWDEIANADLKNNTIVQFWAEAENAKKGIAQNAKVLMSPANKTYLDMKYDSLTKIGLNWAAFIELDSAYIWSPDNFVEEIKRENIIGVESPLWSETITNMNEIEYMAFPRIIGHAEIGWTPNAMRTWSDYKSRLIKHTERMKIMEINYYDSKLLSQDMD
jgi:hexosaminidase